MSAPVINIGVTTRPGHTKFIEWLNGLLANYVTGFWDYTVSNMLQVAFTMEYNVFIQELYVKDGYEFAGFFVISGLTSETKQLIYFDKDGNPVGHNITGVGTMLDFDSNGILHNFFPDVTLPIYDADDNVIFNLQLEYQERYGIKNVTVLFRNAGDTATISRGLLDIVYVGRFGPTYAGSTKPFSALPQYLVTNNTGGVKEIQIPIFTNFSVSFRFAVGQVVYVPVTDWTTHFLKQAAQSNGLGYILVNP